jgi:DNA-binding transcriptional regulator YiaG
MTVKNKSLSHQNVPQSFASQFEMVGVAKITVFQWERGERTSSKKAKILLSKIEED